MNDDHGVSSYITLIPKEQCIFSFSENDEAAMQPHVVTTLKFVSPTHYFLLHPLFNNCTNYMLWES